MKSVIRVRLDRTYQHEPLIVLDGGPFCDAEFSPHRARRMADLLLQLADIADARETTGRYWRPLKQEMQA